MKTCLKRQSERYSRCHRDAGLQPRSEGRGPSTASSSWRWRCAILSCAWRFRRVIEKKLTELLVVHIVPPAPRKESSSREWTFDARRDSRWNRMSDVPGSLTHYDRPLHHPPPQTPKVRVQGLGDLTDGQLSSWRRPATRYISSARAPCLTRLSFYTVPHAQAHMTGLAYPLAELTSSL